MQQLDKILMTAIARDINNGTLLTEADDETIEMVLGRTFQALQLKEL